MLVVEDALNPDKPVNKQADQLQKQLSKDKTMIDNETKKLSRSEIMLNHIIDIKDKVAENEVHWVETDGRLKAIENQSFRMERKLDTSIENYKKCKAREIFESGENIVKVGKILKKSGAIILVVAGAITTIVLCIKGVF